MTNPGEEAVKNLMTGLMSGLGHTMGQLGLFILTLCIASPAIAWMLLLLAEWALPVLKRSNVISGISGFVLTVLTFVALGSTFSAWRFEFPASFPYFCFLLYVPAIFLHVRARHSFNRPRAVGLIAALMPVVLFWVAVALGF